jgi:enoyl-CoA hydratase/carnithine racemase
MGFHHLSVAHDGGVGTLTLIRPPINAINGQVLDEIMTALEAWEGDPAVAAVVVTGGIRNAFCTGGDLQQLFGEEMAGLGRHERMELFDRFQRIYSRIEAYPKPLVAAINGIAIGGGLELALVCDLRVASDVAYFSMPELKHGIIPGLGATQRLSRFIGVGRAKEMLFLGRMVRAETALAWGLVDRLAPRGRVLETARQLAEDLAGKPPAAVRALKACFVQDGRGDDRLRLETEAFARLVDEQLRERSGNGDA